MDKVQKINKKEKGSEERMKPVLYLGGKFRYRAKLGAPDYYRQGLLLKAMQVTSDPKELKKMLNVKTVAEVYRTLDKLKIRREYHRALDENGVSLDFLVKEMKRVAMSAKKDADKVNALKAILKSVGLDSYNGESETGSSSWEDSILAAASRNREEEGANVMEINADGDYEVIRPKLPASVQNRQQEEQDFNKKLYED